MARYAEKLHIVPLFAPGPSTAGDGSKSYAVRLANAQWVSFLLGWGDQTTDDTMASTVTVVSTTGIGNTTGANDVALPFVYRLSAAPGEDNWGDPTTCANTGLSITGAQDNMTLIIDIDPASIPVLDDDAVGLRVVFDGGDQTTSTAYAVALIHDRYPQAEHISASS